MLWNSFACFDKERIEKNYPSLINEDITISQDSNWFDKRGSIIITSFSKSVNQCGQRLITNISYLSEMSGQCGIAILSALPYSDEMTTIILPVVETLCDVYGFNTLMVSTNNLRYAERYKNLGFIEIWQNYNLHTTNIIHVLSKNLELGKVKDTEDEQ